MNQPKVEIVEEKVATGKPNFKDIFNIQTSDDDEPKPAPVDTPTDTPAGQPTKQSKPLSMTDKTRHIIIIVLCCVVIAATIILFVYYFVSARKSKVEILRLTSDCENYKKMADEQAHRESNIIDMYETEKSELTYKITKLEEELDRVSKERLQRQRESFDKKPEQPASIMKKQPSKHSTRSSVPTTQPTQPPKVEVVDEQSTTQQSSDDEQPPESVDEFEIDVPTYEETPDTNKNKSVSPAQQVKNIINGQANKKFHAKMTAINKTNDVVDNYDQEQAAVSEQLGLNRTNQINTQKLNEVVNKMEHAVDEQEDVDELIIN